MTHNPEAFATGEVSRGAAHLIHIACENDQHSALGRHLALYGVVELAVRLPEAARRGLAAVHSLAAATRKPRHFLEFVAALAAAVRRRQEETYGTPHAAELPVWSEYDSHALQALAQALADIAWPERAGGSVQGPSLKRCVALLAAVSARTLVNLVLQHYVGNLLQTYFAEARVRSSVPNLPRDTEILLRSRDAALIARRAMAELREEVNDPEAVLAALRRGLLASAKQGA